MPSLKEYNVKINSLKNTAKVTGTMKMVSTAKFRKAQDAQQNSRLYADSLNEAISRLAANASQGSHPLVQAKSEVNKVLVVLFASDRGLCGGFNNNLFKFVEKFKADNKDKYSNIDFITCGKRADAHVNKDQTPVKFFDGATASVQFTTAKEIGDLAQEAFVSGDYDEVYLCYNIFVSALSQPPTLEKLLPVAPVAGDEAVEEIDYIYEPGQEELLSYLLPKTVNFKVYSAFLENAAGEHAARMAAMDAATTNAKKLINETTVLRNRARQAAITTELTEIVAGAESLK